MTDHLNHTYDPGTDGIICAATLADAAADTALTLDTARELLREAAEAISRACATLSQQPSVEKFAGTFRCESNGIVGYKNAPIHSVTMHDDGVIEVVIDHWPQQPLTDEHKAILKECRNQAMLWTLKARIPESGAFAGIAQDLDYLCGQLGLEEQEASND